MQPEDERTTNKALIGFISSSPVRAVAILRPVEVEPLTGFSDSKDVASCEPILPKPRAASVTLRNLGRQATDPKKLAERVNIHEADLFFGLHGIQEQQPQQGASSHRPRAF